MNKKDSWILTIILASPLIIGIIVAGLFKFDLSKSDWIILVTSCMATFATMLLGFMVFFQTENHKKRQEEDNAFYQEQAKKNRQQDLMLRANPHAAFNKIECIRYAQAPMSLSKENTYNRLTNIDFLNFHMFPEHIYMDLNFNVPQNNVLEHVFIKFVQLKCYKGEFTGGNFEEIASYKLKNYSTDENISNVKINSCGGVDSLLSLLFDLENNENFEQNEIKQLLDDSGIKWAISINYILSNSFKIEIEYKTHINFLLSKGEVDEYGDTSFFLIKPIVTTIQVSNIKVKESN